MPTTLHAAWLRSDEPFFSGQLFFWAENPEESSASAGRASADLNGNGHRTANGRSRQPKVPSHPFQASVGQLRLILGGLVPDLPSGALEPANATVLLPSSAGAPLTRRGPLHRTKSSRGARRDDYLPTLTTWQVTGVTLPPLIALPLLTHLSNMSARRAGEALAGWRQVRLGNDLLFWSNAAKVAVEMLAGQHYLPGLRLDGAGRFWALWQPSLLDERVSRRVDQLTAIMPPICRTYNLDQSGEAPPAAALCEHYLATIVDGAVRAWIGDQPPVAPDSSALQWVCSLMNEHRQLILAPQPAHQLHQEWRNWTDQLHASSDANFRICFELRPPVADGQPFDDLREQAQFEQEGWTLHYGLQARDNPELLVSAGEIWQSPLAVLRIGSRRLDQPQERLLAGLGIASRLFEPIERSLRTPHPEYAELSTEEAHRFLREVGPLLESGGFGLRLPKWWDGHNRMRLGVRLRLSGDEGAGAHAEDSPLAGSIRYLWELALGGQAIDQEEFDALVSMRTPLVRFRGHWVELDPTQVRAAQEFMVHSPRTGTTNLLQAMRVAQLFADGEFDSVPALQDVFDDGARQAPAQLDELTRSLLLEAVDVEGWLQHALGRLRSQNTLQELYEPDSFVGTLRPYQRRGVGWLMYLRQLGLGACLADDMGLGKTIQAIALLLHVRARISDHRRSSSLLICPTSVVANWQHEIERFAPQLQALIHHGGGRLTGDQFIAAMQEHDLVITSYGTARRDIDLLTRFEWDDLILDEAQNIKNPRAKQTQAARRLQARNRIALTGTPVENRLSELWSIMEYLNPGYLGDRERFRRSFIVPIERYNDDVKAGDLRRLVQPFLLRRLKTDPTVISDLPEKNEMVVYCTMTDEQIRLYEETVHDSLSKLQSSDGIRRRGLILALLTRLKQITNHPAQFLKSDGPLPRRSGKLDRLTEMLEEAISVGDHALVFTQFVEMGHLLKSHLVSTLGTEVLFLHGGTPARRRDQMVQSFQASDGPPIFVLSLRAGGSGLNLTRANHVFHFDRWWNPAVENQATDRAFRIGQTRNVQVHKFVVSGTLEERINEMIESKQALAHTIVGSGEEWLTDLDTEQLRDLLLLRHAVT